VKPNKEQTMEYQIIYSSPEAQTDEDGFVFVKIVAPDFPTSRSVTVTAAGKPSFFEKTLIRFGLKSAPMVVLELIKNKEIQSVHMSSLAHDSNFSASFNVALKGIDYVRFVMPPNAEFSFKKWKMNFGFNY